MMKRIILFCIIVISASFAHAMEKKEDFITIHDGEKSWQLPKKNYEYIEVLARYFSNYSKSSSTKEYDFLKEDPTSVPLKDLAVDITSDEFDQIHPLLQLMQQIPAQKSLNELPQLLGGKSHDELIRLLRTASQLREVHVRQLVVDELAKKSATLPEDFTFRDAGGEFPLQQLKKHLAQCRTNTMQFMHGTERFAGYSRVKFTPDGTIKAIASMNNLQEWQLKDNSCVKSWHIPSIKDYCSESFNSDGSQVAYKAEILDAVIVFDTNSAKQKAFLPLLKTLYKTLFTAKDERILGSTRGGLCLWDLAQQQDIYNFPPTDTYSGVYQSLAADKAGNIFMSARNSSFSDAFSVDIFDARTQKCESSLKDGHPHAITALDFDGDNTVVSGDDKGGVCIWDLKKGQLCDKFRAGFFSINSIKFNNQNNAVAIAMEDGVMVTDGEDFQKTWSHDDDVLYAEFSPDDQTVAFACRDNTFGVWKIQE